MPTTSSTRKIPSNEELTDIYNQANNLDPKRYNPITTARIFNAMKAAMEIGYEQGKKENG